jgi:hypothetical protein
MAAWRGLGCPGCVQAVFLVRHELHQCRTANSSSTRLQLLDAHEALLELAALLHHELLELRRPHAHVAVLARQRNVVLAGAEGELVSRLHRHSFAGEGDRLVHQAAGLFLRLLRER